ncbi:MAG: RnfABCDGE type electron transport complex subunit D [Acidobacteria bacterium]|nr:RnfABCDGE type electron transport complex subunit D [Acidobacteriota bacterium]
MQKPEIQLRTSPHLHSPRNVVMIMRNVVYALIPIAAFSVYNFGISALFLLIASMLSCILTERMCNRMMDNESTIGDWSAIITGLLLGLTLPPGFPLWMACVGGLVSIGLGKMLFGGLGFNVFNPALVGRAFLQAAFPIAITAYTPAMATNRFAEFIPTTLTIPFAEPAVLTEWIKQVAVDSFTGATPLMAHKFDHIATDAAALFFGSVAGSAGETSALVIILCGLYLLVQNFADWRIPASMLGTAALLSTIFHAIDPAKYPDAAFTLCSGGLMLGAFFMATDMVSSPVTPLGVWIYGGFIGLLTIVIRFFGGLPEGVMYSILLGNAISPIIESLTQPRVYGTQKVARAKA